MSDYKSPMTRANITTATLALSIAVMALSIIQGYADNQLLDIMLRGGYVSEEELTESYNKMNTLWLTWTTARIITAVTFLMWIFRASRNLRPLGTQNQRYSPEGAVGWWFVPVANLLIPYKVVKELSVGSHPQAIDRTRLPRSELEPKPDDRPLVGTVDRRLGYITDSPHNRQDRHT